jgi:hypothetical protein
MPTGSWPFAASVRVRSRRDENGKTVREPHGGGSACPLLALGALRQPVHVHELHRTGEPVGQDIVDGFVGDSGVDRAIPDQHVHAVVRLEARKQLAAFHIKVQAVSHNGGLDAGERLEFALGDKAAIRLHDHEAPIAHKAVDANLGALQRNGPAALQRVNVQSLDLHGARPFLSS